MFAISDLKVAVRHFYTLTCGPRLFLPGTSLLILTTA